MWWELSDRFGKKYGMKAHQSMNVTGKRKVFMYLSLRNVTYIDH